MGLRARKAVEAARLSVGEVVGAKPEEVLFSSGATESNNLAILGLSSAGLKKGRRHLVTSRVEHKAVLEPMEEMERRGFEVSYLPVDQKGHVEASDLLAALRNETWLVSMMHVNNETGVIQPLDEICDVLASHDCYLHVDGAQSFGKLSSALASPRIDLISISGHKIYGPKGVGALITRRRRYRKPPLEPIQFGGGQERGLRPGTLPVPLIVGLGEAARQAAAHHETRRLRCEEIRRTALEALTPLSPRIHGNPDRLIPHTLNLGFSGLDAEAAMVAVKDLISVSNGSACTSSSYEPSHVLQAMGYEDREVQEAIRLSWCHLTPDPPWKIVSERLAALV